MITIRNFLTSINSSLFYLTPTVPAVMAMVLGILWFLPNSDFLNVWHTRFLVIIGIAFLWLVTYYRHRFCILFCLVGMLLGWLFITPFWQSYLQQMPLPEINGQVKGTVLMINHKNSYATIHIKINEVGFLNSPLEKSSGKIIISHNKELDKDKFFIGAEVLAKGCFLDFDNQNISYQYIMKSNGFHKQFIANQVYSCKDLTWYNHMIYNWNKFKNFLDDRLISGITKVEYAPILSAIVLGKKSDIPLQIRRDFILTGVIHLIAVSGLHSAAIAAIIMWILKTINFKYQYRWHILVVVLGGYIFLTGLSPSAVRTWIMITIFAIYKAKYIYAPPAQVVATAAIIQLLFNPWLIFNSGFQFSYIIIFALLTSLPLVKEWYEVFSANFIWSPFFVIKQSNFTKKIFFVIAGTIIAWIASLGLSLWYNQVFSPISILLNIIVIQLAPILLISGFFKVIISGLPIISNITNFTIDTILSIIEALTNIIANSNLNTITTEIPLIVVFVFYFLFFTFLNIKKHRFISLILLILLIFTSIISPQLFYKTQEKISIHYGGNLLQPTIIIYQQQVAPIVITGIYNSNIRKITSEIAQTRLSPSTIYYLQYRKKNEPNYNLVQPIGINIQNNNHKFIHSKNYKTKQSWTIPEHNIELIAFRSGEWQLIYKNNIIDIPRLSDNFQIKQEISSR